MTAARTTQSPPEVAGPSYTSLSRLQARLKEILAPALGKALWVRAELASVEERNGAVYAELVETSEARRGAVVARMRCTIWSTELQAMRKRFANAGIDLTLQPGTVIGLQCAVSFHPVYGLSLQGLDMDPAFVLGELEVRRRRILAALERDGLLTRNAQRVLALLPNRVLLITSRTSAAYHDFVRVLDGRCRVRILLADAIMQGAQSEASILRALDLVPRLPVELVVIIRGGGSKLDLGSLDSEALARRIASLSLPVWTGIGHETDTSVLDAVAAESFRTPTAVAEALAARFERVERVLRDANSRLRSTFASAHGQQLQRLERSARSLQNGTRKTLALRNAELTRESHRLKLRVAEHVNHARSTTAAAGNQLMRGCQVRVTTEQRTLQQLHSSLRRSATARIAAAQIAGAPQLGRLLGCYDRQIASVRRSQESTAARLQSLVGARLNVDARAIAALRSRLSAQRIQSIVARQDQCLDDWERALRSRSGARVANARAHLDALLPRLRSVVEKRTGPEKATFRMLTLQLMASARRALAASHDTLTLARTQLSPLRLDLRLERERGALSASERILNAHEPQRALERGFSLTYSASGHLIRSISDVRPGAAIKTCLADGQFEATIHATNEGRDDER